MADVLKDTFDPSKGYTRVGFQQQKPLMDFDLNEAFDIRRAEVESIAAQLAEDINLLGSAGRVIPAATSHRVDIAGGIAVSGGSVIRIPEQTAFRVFLDGSAGVQTSTVYVEYWDEEIDYTEDADIYDATFGESAVRTKRNVVVAYVAGAALPGVAPNGGTMFKVATVVHDFAGGNFISADDITQEPYGIAPGALIVTNGVLEVPTEMAWGGGLTPVPSSDDVARRDVVNVFEDTQYLRMSAASYAMRVGAAGAPADSMYVKADGKIEWGNPVSGIIDTNLYRFDSGVLKTDNSLSVGGVLHARTISLLSGNSNLTLLAGAGANFELHEGGQSYIDTSTFRVRDLGDLSTLLEATPALVSTPLPLQWGGGAQIPSSDLVPRKDLTNTFGTYQKIESDQATLLRMFDTTAPVDARAWDFRSSVSQHLELRAVEDNGTTQVLALSVRRDGTLDVNGSIIGDAITVDGTGSFGGPVSSGVAVSAGSLPAMSGAFRIGNAEEIRSRNAANTSDVHLLSLTDADYLRLGVNGEAARVQIAHSTTQTDVLGVLSVEGTSQFLDEVSVVSNLGVNGGYIRVNRAGDATRAEVYLDSDAGYQSGIFFRTGTSVRWLMYGKNGETETGAGNAGSNLDFIRYADDGTVLGTALRIYRANGYAQFEGTVDVGGGLNVVGSSFLSSVEVAGGSTFNSRATFYNSIPWLVPAADTGQIGFNIASNVAETNYWHVMVRGDAWNSATEQGALKFMRNEAGAFSGILTLYATGDAKFENNVNVMGALTAQSLETTGRVSVGSGIDGVDDEGSITLSAGSIPSAGAHIELYGPTHASFASQMYLDASSIALRSQTASTRVSIGNVVNVLVPLNVTGAVDLSSTLNVDGAATFNDTVTVAGSMTVLQEKASFGGAWVDHTATSLDQFQFRSPGSAVGVLLYTGSDGTAAITHANVTDTAVSSRILFNPTGSITLQTGTVSSLVTSLTDTTVTGALRWGGGPSIVSSDDVATVGVSNTFTAHQVITRTNATDGAIQTYASGDAVPRLSISAGGDLEFGGGALARDVSLYRELAGVLKTDGEFWSNDRLLVDGDGAQLLLRSTSAPASYYGMLRVNYNAANPLTLEGLNGLEVISIRATDEVYVGYSGATKVVLGSETAPTEVAGTTLRMTSPAEYSSSPHAEIHFLTKADSLGTFRAFGTISCGKEDAVDGNQDGDMIFSVRANSNGALVEAARFTSTSMLIGTTANPSGRRLVVGGDVEGTAFYETSTREAKHNIRVLEDSALDLLRDVEIVRFNYRDGWHSDPTEERIGFIAEDTASLFSGKRKKNMLTANVVGTLVAAVQELEVENEGLRAELATCKAQVQSIEDRLAAAGI